METGRLPGLVQIPLQEPASDITDPEASRVQSSATEQALSEPTEAT